MSAPEPTLPATPLTKNPRRPSRRKPFVLRLVGGTLMLALGLALLGVIAFAGLVLKVNQGPIDISFAAPSLVSSINSRLSGGLAVSIKSLELEGGDAGLQLTARGFDLAGPDGHLLSGEQAVLALDPWAMLRGQLVPKSVALSQLALIVTLGAQGAITLANGTAAPLTLAKTPAPPPDNSGAPQPAPDAALVASQMLDRLLAANAPLAALHHVVIRQSSIILRDLARGSTIRLVHVDLSLARQTGGIKLDISALDGAVPWHAEARVQTRSADSSHLVHLKIDHWSFTELQHLANNFGKGLRADISGTMTAEARLSQSGKLMSLAADVEGGRGMFMANNPDFEPVLFDNFSLKAHYDPARQVYLVDQAQLISGDSMLSLAGQITPASGDNGSITFNFTTGSGTRLATSRPRDKTLLVSSGRIAGSFDPVMDTLQLDKFNIDGPALHVAANANAAFGATPHLVAQTTFTSMQARDVIRLWPSSLAAPLRAWFRQRLTAGKVASLVAKIDFDAHALTLAGAQQPVPDAAMHVTGTVNDVSLQILDGFPAVTGVNATGMITGHTVDVAFNAGQITAEPGKTLKIASGTFIIHNSSLIPIPATILANMSGTLATTTQLLAKDALRPFVHLPLDPKSIAGNISGQLQVDTLLGDHLPPSATKVGVTAKISNFSADNLIGKASLTQGALNFKVGPTGMNASGTGTIFVSPAKLVLIQPTHGKGEGKLNFTLSDAARKKLNIAVAGISGPIGVAIIAPLGGTAPVVSKGKKPQVAHAAQQAQVTLDLGATTLDAPFPGLLKAPGRPGRASFTALVQPHDTALKDLSFDGGGVSFAGTATLGADGHLQSAQLSRLKLSALDHLQASVTFGSNATKVVATGANFDMRSVWDSLTGPDKLAKPTLPGKAANIDISLTASKVTGYNDEVMQNGRFLLERMAGKILAFKVGGQLGQGRVTGALATDGAIHVTTSDAGAALAFLNLYSHMHAGLLDLNAHLTGSDASGSATIHKFALVNEPRLQQIASAGNSRQNSQKIRLTSVPFQKLEAQFSSHAGAISIANAVIFGPDVGISMKGVLNFPKNRMDVNGTFVPAYGINNIFSRIPLLGPLLGGGRHEGLFAVNYRISGPMSHPSLNFNPLSAIAPGFLRQIFGTSSPAVRGSQGKP